MNREAILKEFRVVDGLIQNPGKFEGEPIFSPYFYGIYLEGFADSDDGTTLTFDLTETDLKDFPELKGCTKAFLEVDEAGFVYCTTNGLKEITL